MTHQISPWLRLQADMNRLFESFFEDLPGQRMYAETYPAINIWDDGENGYLEAELPGLSAKDVELLVRGNQVSIRGERRIPEEKGATWHRRERAQGRFTRALTLPWEINADKVEAKWTDGVLMVKLPKSESNKPRRVPVLTA
jgi:HSP20 family protein